MAQAEMIAARRMPPEEVLSCLGGDHIAWLLEQPDPLGEVERRQQSAWLANLDDEAAAYAFLRKFLVALAGIGAADLVEASGE